MDRINFSLIALGIASFVYLVEPRTVYLDGVPPRVMRYERVIREGRNYLPPGQYSTSGNTICAGTTCTTTAVWP